MNRQFFSGLNFGCIHSKAAVPMAQRPVRSFTSEVPEAQAVWGQL